MSEPFDPAAYAAPEVFDPAAYAAPEPKAAPKPDTSWGTAVRKFFDPSYPAPGGDLSTIGKQALKGASLLVPGSGAASLAGGGALYGVGDSNATDAQGLAADALKGSGSALAAGGLLKVAGKALAPAAKWAGEKLGGLAESAAVRSANADRTAYRAAFGKPANVDKIHDTGRLLLDQGVPLRSPAAMQAGLEDVLSTNGDAIGSLASKASQGGAKADLEAAALRALQHPDVAALGKNTETRALGERVVQFLDDQIKQHGNQVTPEVLWDIRRQLDPLSKWSQTNPAPLADAYRAVRQTLNDELGTAMGGAGLGAEWQAANKTFSLAKGAKRLADVGAERRAGNRLGSPSEKGAAIAGGIAAALHNPLAAVAVPAATVAANRLAMPAAAHGFDLASRLAAAMSRGGAEAPAALLGPVAAAESPATLAEYLAEAMRRAGRPGLLPAGADRESSR